MDYLRILAVLLATLPFSSANAADIYRWQAEDGTWHFSETPPSNSKAEAISIAVPKISQTPPAATPEDTVTDDNHSESQKTDIPPVTTKSPEVAAEDRALQQQNCKIAKENLKSLSAGGRTRYQLPSGEITYLTQDEKDQRIAKATANIRKYCD